MVFRPYTAKGVLLTPLSKTSTLAVVGVELSTLLGQAAVDNWCFLQISYGGVVEIVKVIHSAEGKLHICRARDNTVAQNFPVGAVLQYVQTAEEVKDSVIPTELAIFTQGAARVTNHALRYREFNIEFLGVNYLIGDGSSKLAIGRHENAYGCCNGNNDPAGIDGRYFVLTTKLYPVEVREGLEFTADALVQLLTIPINSDPLEFTPVIVGLELRNPLRTYSYAEEASTDIELTDVDIKDVLKDVSLNDYSDDATGGASGNGNEEFQMDMLLTEVDVKDILIQYLNWPLTATPDESLEFLPTVVGVSLHA